MYFFFAAHLPLPLPLFCASHTCYASLLLLLTLTSSLTSHAGVLGAIPLCAAPRSAQLLRDVEYKRVEKSRVEQRYGERDIRTGKSGNRNEYVNKKKTRRGEGDEAKRQRQKHSEKNARVRFVASDLRRGGGESIAVVVGGGGRCVWNEE